MKKITVKALCALLAALMLLSLSAVPAFASIPGDVDGNGKVAAADARIALRAAVKLETLTPGSEAFTAAELTGDGKVTAADARKILRIAVKLEDAPTGQTTDYDILRSGKFYLTGTMKSDGEPETPMAMALGSDMLYMEMHEEDLNMGILVKDKSIYLLNTGAKKYYKMSSADMVTLKTLGVDFPDAEALEKEIKNFGFQDLAPLDRADKVSDASVGGVACKRYTFLMDDGEEYRVYMNGSRLMALESVAANGTQDMYMKVSSITGQLPTMPPSDYRRALTMISFAADLM